MPIKKGDKVKIDYTGALEDGTVFDSSDKHGHPIEFEVGSGKVIKGFEDSVIGMEKGQEKEIKILPKDGYGQHNPEMLKKVPKAQLPPEAKEGSVLLLTLPNGVSVPVKVIKIEAEEAELDLNHPLAGKTLNFKIKVVDVSSS